MNNEHKSSDSQTSIMEETLPDQIMENVLLEGVNSTHLLQNADIVNFSNILANLRYDLSSILNEDIDEFQFQTICHDLLAKTSENIKIKSQISNKSQCEQPKPIQNEINIDDIYAHLRRQPGPIVQTEPEIIEIVDKQFKKKLKEKINQNATKLKETTKGSFGWNSYLSQVCNHDKNKLNNDISNECDSDENKEDIIECEPGAHAITLMGNVDGDNDNKVKFKNINKCYQDIFNENMDNMMHEIQSVTNQQNNNNNDDSDSDSDSDTDNDNDNSLIVSNVTLMGHETIQ